MSSSSPAAGRAWAAASGRTLARRLRREHAQRLGPSRGAALAWRLRALRQALCAHWELDDLIGGHCASLRDAINAAALIKAVDAGEVIELNSVLAAGNWARHAAPPGVAPLRPAPRAGIPSTQLEIFRDALYGSTREVDDAGGPCSSRGTDVLAAGGSLDCRLPAPGAPADLPPAPPCTEGPSSATIPAGSSGLDPAPLGDPVASVALPPRSLDDVGLTTANDSRSCRRAQRSTRLASPPQSRQRGIEAPLQEASRTCNSSSSADGVYHRGNPFQYLSLYRKHIPGPSAKLVERYRECDEHYIAFCRRSGVAVDANALQLICYADGVGCPPAPSEGL